MNEMYNAFERMLEQYGVFRVEHSGDSYMVVSGHDGTTDHVDRMLALASDMIQCASGIFYSSGDSLPLRIGLHCGPAYAGVVGMDNPRYCVFGETVLIASSLESQGPPCTVHVSKSVVMASTHPDKHFVAYQPELVVGSHTVSTYLCQMGKYKDAVAELEASTAATAATAASSAEMEERLNTAETELGALKAAAPHAARDPDPGARDPEHAAAAALLSAQAEIALLRAQLLDSSEAAARDARGARAADGSPGGGPEGPELRRQSATAAGSVLSSHPLGVGAGAGGGGGGGGARLLRASSSAAWPDHAGGDGKHGLGVAGGGQHGLGAGGAGGAGVGRAAGSRSPAESFVSRSTLARTASGAAAQRLYSLEEFLGDMGLGQYEEMLSQQELTPLVLATMTDAELKGLGVSAFGARKRILDAAADYLHKVESVSMMAIMTRDAQAQQAHALGRGGGSRRGGGSTAGSVAPSEAGASRAR
ncbi:hypothetical protein FOA52_011190 [Chlamydomonas sp. UWO 241]|nr:hypothetical protein FOA52_011190 [Chlamydomonas sp. UWO 241]